MQEIIKHLKTRAPKQSKLAEQNEKLKERAPILTYMVFRIYLFMQNISCRIPVKGCGPNHVYHLYTKYGVKVISWNSEHVGATILPYFLVGIWHI